LNIAKEALQIGGEEHDEYSNYYSSEWDKVVQKHQVCQNQLVDNNKRIHDVEK